MSKLKSYLKAFARSFQDPNIMTMVVVFILIWLFLIQKVHAVDVRTVNLNQTRVARISITPGRSTVLSFPTKPTKVILGNQGVFAIEYVENDLAIAALSPHSHSDLFVYLDGRRFAFDLSAVVAGGDTIVLVRDAIPDSADDSDLVTQKAKPHHKKDSKAAKKAAITQKDISHE